MRGISDVTFSAKSWMSAAGFERVSRTLVDNAIKGSTDDLRGLMENVMIGNLIPAGTGLSPDFVPALMDIKQDEISD